MKNLGTLYDPSKLTDGQQRYIDSLYRDYLDRVHVGAIIIPVVEQIKDSVRG